MSRKSVEAFLNKKNLATLFFLIISVYVTWLLFTIFQPYFWSFFLALLFYISAKKGYNWLADFFHNKGKIRESIAQTFAAFIAIFLIFGFMIIPAVFLLRKISAEFVRIITFVELSLRDFTLENLHKTLPFLSPNYFKDNEIFAILQKYILQIFERYTSVNQNGNISEYLSQLLKYLQGGLQTTFGITSNLLLALLITFFILLEEKRIFKVLLNNLPFQKNTLKRFFDTSYHLVLTLIKGNLLIALLQGIYISIGLFLFGIQGFIFYGFLAGLATLIPVVGSSLVWLPIGVYLLVIGKSYLIGIALMIYGLIGFVFIEVILKPTVLQTKLNIHPLLIFFSLLGGIIEFGAIGVIIGPLVLSLFVILWKNNPIIR